MPNPDDTSPDARMIRAIHKGLEMDEVDADYPAHLHIDLLPIAQGQGFGKKLMQTFLTRLREFGVPGVNLGVSKKNPRAVRFYERVGFQRVTESKSGIIFGMRL